MQLLPGLLFFSILLTTGSSLNCTNCVAIDKSCTGPKLECPPQSDACMDLVLKIEEKIEHQPNAKICSTKEFCKEVQDLIGKPIPDNLTNMLSGLYDLQGPVTFKSVVCSKAPPSFALFFPAFLGLFLMKLLF